MTARISLLILLCLGAGCAARAPAPEPQSEASSAPGDSSTTMSKPAAPAPAPSKPKAASTTKKKKPSDAASKPTAPEAPPAPAPLQTPWQQTLARLAGDQQLRLNAHYFPSLAWLSARWCIKGGDREPALFYNVDRTPTGFLNLVYGDRGGNGKRYNHVQINGNFFDIWDEFDFSDYLKGEGGRRLEKRSDDEFALVYVFAEKPETDRYDRQVFLDFTARRAAAVGPRQHLRNPDVYVKCE